MATPQSAQARKQFRPDIQGLRAISVIAVVMFHANHKLMPAGYLGVDIFFVISGFLIGGIIAADLEKGRYSLQRFYGRRVRRIFPALLTMLAAVLVAGLLLLPPDGLKELAVTALATACFVSNFAFYALSGYFDGAAASKPLLHTWSLGVEEQFYLLFPPFLALLWRWKRSLTQPALWFLVSVSLAGSVVLGVHHPNAAFFWTPARAFELFTGALLVKTTLGESMSATMRQGLSWAALSVIVLAVTVIPQPVTLPAVGESIACAGAALFILCGKQGSSSAGNLLSVRALTFFGDISYSLYLWHWPIFVFGRLYFAAPLTPQQIALLVGASVFMASLSWRFIERPMMKSTLADRPLLAWGAASMGVVVAFSGVVISLRGLPSRFSPDVLRIFQSAQDHSHDRSRCDNPTLGLLPFDRNCIHGFPGAAPMAAVWGDSHAAELVIALGNRMQPLHQSIMQISAPACPPALNFNPPLRPFCAEHNAATLASLIHAHGIRTVILVANFALYQENPAEWDQLSTGYSQLVAALRAAGKQVVLVHQIPAQQFDPPVTLARAQMHGDKLEAYGTKTQDQGAIGPQVDGFLDELANRMGAGQFLPSDVLCDRAFCRAYDSNYGCLYYDSEHLSLGGARLVAERFPLSLLH